MYMLSVAVIKLVAIRCLTVLKNPQDIPCY